MGLIKLKNLCTAEEAINKMKRQPEEQGRRSNRHFFKEGRQIVQKHMKRCSISLIIREMQIKAAMRYDLTPVKMSIIKKSTINVGKGVKKRTPSYTVGMNINSYNHYGELYGESLKN